MSPSQLTTCINLIYHLFAIEIAKKEQLEKIARLFIAKNFSIKRENKILIVMIPRIQEGRGGGGVRWG